MKYLLATLAVALFAPTVWAADVVSDVGNEWESRIGRDTQPQQGSAPTLCFQKGIGMISCFEQRKAATSGGKYCLYKSATSGAFAASCKPSGDLSDKGDATGGKQDSSSSGSSSGNSSSGNSSGGNSSGGNSSGGSVSVVGGGGSSSAGGGSAAGTSSSSSSSSSSTERRETPESVRKAYEAWQKKWQDEFKRLEGIAVSIKETLAKNLKWCIDAYGGGTPNQILCSNSVIANAENELNNLREQIAKAESQAAKELAELNKQYNVSGNVGSPTPPTVIVDGGSSSSNSNSSNSNNGSDASNSNNQSSGNNNGDGGTTYITNNTTNNHTTHHNTTNNTNNYTTDSAETNGLLATISGKMGELGTAIKDLAGKVKELATSGQNNGTGSGGSSGDTTANNNGSTSGTGQDDGKDASGKDDGKTNDAQGNQPNQQPASGTGELCKENPDILACQKVEGIGSDGTEEPALPKHQKQIDFKTDDFLGNSNAVCPAPIQVDLTYWQAELSYDALCEIMVKVRGLVIAVFALSGAIIFARGLQ